MKKARYICSFGNRSQPRQRLWLVPPFLPLSDLRLLAMGCNRGLLRACRSRSRVRHTLRVPDAYAGRLLDHVHLRVSDLGTSRRFYEAVLEVFGIPLRGGEEWFSADELFFSADSEPTRGAHIALQAPDEDAVRRFHQVGLAAGGRDNGRPGERDYHPGYYSAYVLDPDGTNVEAVYHGPVQRSAAAVEFTWQTAP